MPSIGIIMRIISGLFRFETQFLLEIQDYFITKVSEETEGRVTNKLCQEFIRPESGFLGALSRLDELLLNPKAWDYSRPVPETSWNSNRENGETNGDRSQSDPPPELFVSLSQSSQVICPEKTSCSLICFLVPIRNKSIISN